MVEKQVRLVTEFMLFPLRKKKFDKCDIEHSELFTIGLDDQSGLLESTDVAPWSASSTISDSGSSCKKKGNRHIEP